MDLYELFDELEDTVGNASRIPLTGKVIIGEDELMEILEEIRNAVPDELRQAKWVLKERQRIMDEAQEEAGEVVAKSQEYRDQLVAEHEIAAEARQQAEEIVRQAREQSQELQAGASEYADQVLAQLEERLGQLLQQVQMGRQELQRSLGVERVAEE